MTVLCGTLFLVISAASASAPPSALRLTVDVAGALAHVEVDRALAPAPTTRGKPAGEGLLELALPAGAVPLGWELVGAGRGSVATGGPATSRYAEAWRARLGRGATEIPPARPRPDAAEADDGADWWLRYVAAPDERPRVRLRYVAPLACRGGRLVLGFPAGLEPDAVAPELRVRVRVPGVRGAVVTPGARRELRAGVAAFRTTAPARGAWELSIEPAVGAGDVVVASESATRSAIGLCRSPAAPVPRAAARFVFAMDRSRSVGSAGLSIERELARAFVEQSAGTARFEVVPFARTAGRLFGVARLGTREALAALDDAFAPAALAKGSELAPALAIAGHAAVDPADSPNDEAASPSAGRIVVLTDGALPEGTSGTELAGSLGSAAAPVAVLVARPREESPPPESAVTVLRAIPRARGGILRVVAAEPAARVALDALADLAAGGDWFDVDVVSSRGPAVRIAPEVAPGRGAHAVAAARATQLRYAVAGRTQSRALRPVQVPAAWIDPPPAPDGWTAASATAAALVTRAPSSGAPPEAAVCGRLDRDVVRNTLALAYMPRVRACYLARPATTAASRALEGRVRLALAMDRGELVDARVEASTLAQPGIEACLRDAAYQVEVPRPSRCDAPSVARLNLVFRPHAPAPDAGTRSPDELDVVLGPVDLDFDARSLLEPAPPAAD